MNSTATTIELRIYEIRPHLDEIMVMFEAGVFDFKNGYAEIHRDNEGKLREIKVIERRWKC